MHMHKQSMHECEDPRMQERFQQGENWGIGRRNAVGSKKEGSMAVVPMETKVKHAEKK